MIKEVVRKKVDGEWVVTIPEVVLKSLLRQSEKVQELEAENRRYREAIEVAIHNMAVSDNLGVKFALRILEQVLEVEE